MITTQLVTMLKFYACGLLCQKNFDLIENFNDINKNCCLIIGAKYYK